MSRHQSRVVAMQTLYQYRFGSKDDIEKIIEENIKKHPSENLEKEYITRSVNEAIDHFDDIDKTISIAAPDWPLEQIDQVDLAVLTVGVYELLYRMDIPPKVAIDEAVELGKEFGGENSPSFINGVLGTVFRASDRYKGEESEEPGPQKDDKNSKKDKNKKKKENSSEKKAEGKQKKRKTKEKS